MKNWQLILTATLSGVTFVFTLTGPNLLTPTVSWTLCVLSLYSIGYKNNSAK
jgi:hypothetical protein